MNDKPNVILQKRTEVCPNCGKKCKRKYELNLMCNCGYVEKQGKITVYK